MKRRDFISAVAKTGLLIAASGSVWQPFTPLMGIASAASIDAPPEFGPNDPAYDSAWAHQLNLPEAWYLEKHTLTPLVPQVVIVQLDFFVDSTMDDLQPNVLDQYHADFSGGANYNDGSIAGTSNAALMSASTDNAIRVSSIAGISGRVKVVPVKILTANGVSSLAKVRQGLQYTLDLINQYGLPVVAAVCNVGGFDDNPTATRGLLQQLASHGVYVFANAAQGGANLDTTPNVFPACYATDPNSNVIAVGAIDAQDSLTSFSNFGPNTVTHVALGQNVPVTYSGILDPTRPGRATGMSLVAPQVAAAYAMVRLFRTTDPMWAAYALKQTVRPVSTLSGKIGSGGVIDLYAALTATGIPAGPLRLVMEQGSQSTAVVAVDSLLQVRDPFVIVNHNNRFNDGSADKNTRIVLFVANLQLLPGEGLSAVGVVASTTNNNYSLSVEDVRPLPEMASLSQLTVRLANSLPVGTLSVTVNLHGQASNSGTIRII